MSYSKGQLWCKGTGSAIDVYDGGEDEIQIEEPLQHNHVNTRAETLTGPLSKNFGGGQLIGDFTVGSKDLLTQSVGYGPSKNGKVGPLEHAVSEQETLTYPLWG